MPLGPKAQSKTGKESLRFMFDDDSTDHKVNIGLSKHFTHSTSTSSPSTLIPASLTHTHADDYPMTASRTRIRGELTDSMWAKSASDCNNDTMLLDNYLNPILPSPMTVICTSKPRPKMFNHLITDREMNSSKMTSHFITSLPQLPVPGPATLHVILSLPMGPAIHQPIMTFMMILSLKWYGNLPGTNHVYPKWWHHHHEQWDSPPCNWLHPPCDWLHPNGQHSWYYLRQCSISTLE